MNKEIKRMTTIIGNVKPFYVETIAEALYNAGYRKIFTSDLARYIQRGYIKGIEEREAENERLTERLKQVLLSIDTVKEMNTMCDIYEQRKQAVKEFAEKLKGKLQDFGDGGEKGAYITEKDIDELIKEIEK